MNERVTAIRDQFEELSKELQSLQIQLDSATIELARRELQVNHLNEERTELLSRAYVFNDKPHLLFAHIRTMAATLVPDDNTAVVQLMDEAYSKVGEWKKADVTIADLKVLLEKAQANLARQAVYNEALEHQVEFLTQQMVKLKKEKAIAQQYLAERLEIEKGRRPEHKSCREVEDRLRNLNRQLQATGAALERDKLIQSLRKKIKELESQPTLS